MINEHNKLVIKNFLTHKHLLKKLEYKIDRIINLDLNNLINNNIKALIIDFDGVLTYQGPNTPLPETIAWLEQAVNLLGANKIFILSNNPAFERQQFFSKYFNNNIIFITNTKLKPDPEGITYAINYLANLDSSIEKAQILMIEDRIATGILAAKLAGISCCLITKPYVNLIKNFKEELLFIIFRLLEKLITKI